MLFGVEVLAAGVGAVGADARTRAGHLHHAGAGLGGQIDQGVLHRGHVRPMRREEEHRVRRGQLGLDGRDGGEVPLHQFGIRREERARLTGVPDQGTNPFAAGNQRGDDVRTEPSGGAGDEDGHHSFPLFAWRS